MIPALSMVAHRVALFLAQEAPPAPAGGQPAPGAAPGGAPAPGGGAPSSPFGSFLIPLVLIFVVFYFLIILPERRKTKTRQAMIKGVKKGDGVVTTAGIIGKVVRVEDHEVVLQIDKDNDVRVRFLKSAIHEVVPEGIQGGEKKEESK